MYICIYENINIHIHVCIYMYTCIYIHRAQSARPGRPSSLCIHVCVCMCVCVCVRARVWYTYMYAYIHTYIHTYTRHSLLAQDNHPPSLTQDLKSQSPSIFTIWSHSKKHSSEFVAKQLLPCLKKTNYHKKKWLIRICYQQLHQWLVSSQHVMRFSVQGQDAQADRTCGYVMRVG